MKTLKTTLFFAVLTSLLTHSSCNKDDDNTVSGAFSNGMFIVNEGPFQTGTGTITYYNPDSNLVKQDIFEMVNGRPLGNIAQSMTIYKGKAYIVVNNAGTVEVVDASTFKSEGTISGFVNPCQFIGIDDEKAYVSDWIGHVAVIDINTKAITKTISAGTGPDVMLKTGNYVYVANTGGFSVDSTVTVIDFATDQVVKTIHVGEVPSGMVADADGRVWVMCKGLGYNGWPQAGDTPGSLVRIDPALLEIDYAYHFSLSDVHPEKLVINKQKSILYFLYNYGIYRFNISSGGSLPEEMIDRSFYSLGYENKTGYLYASDVKDYVSDGIVLRIKAEDGSVVDSIQAGIVPRGFTFPE